MPKLFMCILHKRILRKTKSKWTEYKKNKNLLNLHPSQVIKKV